MAATKAAITRTYDTTLRQQRADETRERIVAAGARLVAAERPPDIAVPTIAAEAGVGVATVYRHFATKDAVIDAIYDHWMARARELLSEHSHLGREQLLELLPELWRRQSEDEGLERAMSAYSPVGRAARRRRTGRRRQVAIDAVADVRTDDETRTRLQAVVLLLTSTTAHRHFRDHWAMSTDDAAAAAAWAVRALVDQTQA